MQMVSLSGGGSYSDGAGGSFSASDSDSGGGWSWSDNSGYGWGDNFAGEDYGSLRADGQPFGYGCGSASTDILVPDRPAGINLLPACVAHDLCYNFGTVTPRSTCDAILGEQVRKACADAGYPALACAILAATYETGVRVLGADAYNVAVPPPEETIHLPLDTYLYY